MKNRMRALLKKRAIIGMVHLDPLPGSPMYQGSVEKIYENALKDLKALQNGGADAAIIENFHDEPYTKENELITKLAMMSIATRLKQVATIPLGINFHFNDVETEWEIAYIGGFDFIRVEVFAENRISPFGILEAKGPELMRLKNKYNADVCILGDISVKQTFPIAPEDMNFVLGSMVAGGVDGIIVTGLQTGQNPSIEDVKNISKVVKGTPIVIGSGAKEGNIKEYLKYAKGCIVGSSLKVDGNVNNAVDEKRVKAFMKACE